MPVLNLTDIITTHFEANNFTIDIFLDLSKAFDVIGHKLLLHKLNYYGMNGVSHKWSTSYLFNRKQFSHINSISSSHLNIKFGVPEALF